MPNSPSTECEQSKLTNLMITVRNHNCITSCLKLRLCSVQFCLEKMQSFGNLVISSCRGGWVGGTGSLCSEAPTVRSSPEGMSVRVEQ